MGIWKISNVMTRGCARFARSIIETLVPLVAPSLHSGRYSFRALWLLFNLYPYVSLSNYYLYYTWSHAMNLIGPKVWVTWPRIPTLFIAHA